MEKYGFKIKVSDLLQSPGTKDTISFEKKFTKNIENLSDFGIKGEVFLQGLDKKSLLVRLQNIETKLDAECEVSGKEFTQEINIDSYESKFFLPGEDTKEYENIEDEVFMINEKDETIDIEEMLVQAIILNKPIVAKCEEVIKRQEKEDEDTKIDDMETQNTINWIYKN